MNDINKKICVICYKKCIEIKKYCDKCIDVTFCQICVNKLIKNNFLKCPVCMTHSQLHALIYFDKLFKNVTDKYYKVIDKFLKNKAAYGNKRTLYTFKKIFYNNEYILVYNGLFIYNLELLKFFLLKLKKETKYEIEIKKALNYVISTRI